VNEYQPGQPIDLLALIVCPQSEPCTNPRPYLYKADGAYRRDANRSGEYLVSLGLAPGAYVLDSVGVQHSTFFTYAGGYTPLKMKIEIAPNTVSYLGHMDVVLRKKASERERTAGREQVDVAVVQVELKDGGIAGFSAGTMDIRMEDAFDEDMRSFILQYPALRGVKVEKSVLRQWTRPEDR
jgi:hypothetical protein